MDPPPPSVQQLTQLQLLAAPPLLHALLRAALPHTTAPDLSPDEALAGALARGPAVQSLCSVLARVLEVPGTQQRALISLSTGGQMVERLWYSFLGPLQLAEGPLWEEVAPADEDGSCDPGWMRVLVLLAQVFNCYILTAGVRV